MKGVGVGRPARQYKVNDPKLGWPNCIDSGNTCLFQSALTSQVVETTVVHDADIGSLVTLRYSTDG